LPDPAFSGATEFVATAETAFTAEATEATEAGREGVAFSFNSSNFVVNLLIDPRTGGMVARLIKLSTWFLVVPIIACANPDIPPPPVFAPPGRKIDPGVSL
jgi:hypothetical protein